MSRSSARASRRGGYDFSGTLFDVVGRERGVKSVALAKAFLTLLGEPMRWVGDWLSSLALRGRSVTDWVLT